MLNFGIKNAVLRGRWFRGDIAIVSKARILVSKTALKDRKNLLQRLILLDSIYLAWFDHFPRLWVKSKFCQREIPGLS